MIGTGLASGTDLSQILFRRRKELGITQSELARRVGVQPNYIVYLEKGHRRPSDRTLLRLADALGLQRGDLYLAANPQVRDFLAIADDGQVHPEAPAGLRQLMEDGALRERLQITEDELATVARVRVPGRALTAEQYLTLILTLRAVFA